MENMKKLMQELLDLNMSMIKDGEISDEYADYIIEIKNNFERNEEELKYLEEMR